MTTTKDTKTSAAEAETKAEMGGVETVSFEVTVKDTTVKLTTPLSLDDAPLEVMEAFEANQNARAFMALVGPQQAAKLRSAGITPRILTEVIIPAWEEATGLGEG